MRYFTQQHHQSLTHASMDERRETYIRMAQLHHELRPHLKNHHIDLYTAKRNGKARPSTTTVAARDADEVLTVHYWRTPEEAQIVERLMGRESLDMDDVNVMRHPVIELRLTPTYFAIELIISPDAWWDQQNVAGKLSVVRHRNAIYQKLQSLSGDYCLGFWEGTTLTDVHLNADQFRWKQVLDEWLSTFEAGKDWFRLGIWYDVEDEFMESDQFILELARHLKTLHDFYTELLWTGDNNYRTFYKRVAQSAY